MKKMNSRSIKMGNSNLTLPDVFGYYGESGDLFGTVIIDTQFDFRTDSNGRDIDSASLTLRKYHKILWSKPLPNGKIFRLSDEKANAYLYHKSELGEFYLGSDVITQSYGHQVRKQWIFQQIQDEVNEFYVAECTIGSYIIFPNKRIMNNHTINQARGCNRLIDDRFDLTLECIRRFYLGQTSPLYDTLLRYKSFFDLFGDFMGYVEFFLLQDLVDECGGIKFYLPFDNFRNSSVFSTIDDYRLYKRGAMEFIRKRNNRIAMFSNVN
jgi:hypothetical protein